MYAIECWPSTRLQSPALEKQVEYDVKVYENWSTKVSTVAAARFHATQGWRLERRLKCKEAATKHLRGLVRLIVMDRLKPEQVIGEIMSFKREIADKMSCTNSKDLPCVFYLNWTAPCLIKEEFQHIQIGCMSWGISENMQSVGVVNSPVFTYNKGRLHLEESKCSELLTKGNHNIDVSFYMNFTDKQDGRDGRPMVYPGRFVFAAPLSSPSKNMFWDCELCKRRRTDEIPQLEGKQMREIEDLASDALPTSTDSRDAKVHGAAKASQLGVNACEKVLQGIMIGPNWKNVRGCFLVDLWVKVGDMLDAFLNSRSGWKVNAYYIGLCENQTELAWVMNATETKLAEEFEAMKQLPTGEVLEDNMNPDLLEPIEIWYRAKYSGCVMC